MSEKAKCPSCGATLTDDLAGVCAACMLEVGLAAQQSSDPMASGPRLAEGPGDRIGRYKLLQQIGEGGCGVVFMAEQSEPVRRLVALKIIKLGMDTKQVVARFEAERQALAMMDHPNIAKVLDAGATEAGRPYFVMELVRGIKITNYCDQQKLSTAQRVSLFIEVCQAVQHAHQKGIIHRDLKPSNILVSEQDDKAVPKVIDFGIAKATTAASLTDRTLFTAFHQFLGTPAYMSPEQAGWGGLDIDTRSDVYSLGVLLYELLTGKQPFDSTLLRRCPIDEILRTIREQEPPRPSACLTTLTEQERTVAGMQRQSEPMRLSNLLRGDLDWIVMKTLEKDRARRYDSAIDLASDLRRYLDHEPVQATPPSAIYRFQKMVRRNRLAFTAASGVLAVLILGTAVSAWQAVRATRAEREQNRLRQEAERQSQQEKQLRQKAEAAEKTAQTEAVKSQQVVAFLTEMIQGVESPNALGRDTTVLREILDKAAERIEVELKDQPEAQADMMEMLGMTYNHIYQYTPAGNMLRKALAARRKFEGNESSRIATLLHNLSNILGGKEGIAMKKESLAMSKRLYAKNPDKENHVNIFYTSIYLAEALSKEGEFSEVDSLAREALAMLDGSADFGNPEKENGLLAYGRILRLEGKPAEAETVYREALASKIKRLGSEHLEVATAERFVADTLLDQDKLDEAEKFYRDTVRLFRAQWKNTPDINESTALKRLGLVLRKRGKLTEAEKYIRESLAMRIQLYENRGQIVADTRQDLFQVLCQEKKFPEAQIELALWLKGERLRCAAQPSRLARGLGQMGDFLYAQGKTNEAMPYYQEIVSTCLPALHEDDPESLDGLAWFQATCLAPAFRNSTNAIWLGEKAVHITGRKNPEMLGVLAAAYAADGQFDKAVAAQKEAAHLPQEITAKAESAARLALYENRKTYENHF
jgi:serine/threonine protein kinase